MPECRSCKAPVMFVPSEANGRLMILDAEPVADGRIVIRAGKARVLTGDLYEPAVEDGGRRFKDHHATCPDAKSYRRAKK